MSWWTHAEQPYVFYDQILEHKVASFNDFSSLSFTLTHTHSITHTFSLLSLPLFLSLFHTHTDTHITQIYSLPLLPVSFSQFLDLYTFLFSISLPRIFYYSRLSFSLSLYPSLSLVSLFLSSWLWIFFSLFYRNYKLEYEVLKCVIVKKAYAGVEFKLRL